MEDKKFMRRCIELAKKGLGYTYPNPLVGCVIVHNGKIISEGWHKKAGNAHAEVEAIEKIKDKSILKEATLYVNLEPCNHYGKTPPCSALILKMKIPRVVIGTVDYNEQVFHQGIKKLEKNGCNVKTGLLEKECIELNLRFFTFHQKKRPYIILKWAESKDGFLAPKDPSEKYWLTNTLSKQMVHQWRSEEQAIMIGVRTAILDNPRLDTRLWHGNNPIPVIIDSKHKLSNEQFLFANKKSNNLLTIPKKQIANKQAKLDLKDLINYLHENKIQSVIIEGGAKTLDLFIKNNLWDEARVFKSSMTLKEGLAAPKLRKKENSVFALDDDKLYTYNNF